MRATTWYEALNDCQQKGRSYVLVTVLLSAGSTPREAGCKMLVTGEEQFDTIGGGHLEHEAIQTARELLVENQQAQKIVSYPLSSSLGQCCGGAVKILYEVHVEHHQHLAIFGAGHVAQSLVPMLAQLPVQISWIDSRDNFFNGNLKRVPESILALSNVKAITNDEPTQELEKLPDNAWVIILTHNHQLDYELIETALKHGSLGFIGMIGSETKAKRFITKLEHRGFSRKQIEQVTSPIGDLSIPGKRPVEVSVSICAQLIKLQHAKKQLANQVNADVLENKSRTSTVKNNMKTTVSNELLKGAK